MAFSSLDCPYGYIQCYLPDMNETFKLCVLAEMDFMNFNFSLSEVSRILHEHQTQDHNIDHTTEMTLIFIYALLIVSGLLANLIVSFVVARKTQMHTPRNLYIVNLTASDMTLCAICMPFTLAAVIKRHWTLGLTLCKLLPALQGTNILVSVGTITVIALDRYLTIVRGQEGRGNKRRVIVSIAAIWLFSALATAPLFYYQMLIPVRFDRLVLYEMCVEQWPSQSVKVLYTAAVMMIQAVIPAIVVAGVHTRIATHLRQHAFSHLDQRRVHRDLERNRRTTLLLSLMTILFALSWLPLSVFTLTADILFSPDTIEQVSSQRLYVAFSICHVVAMSSAVSNPVVYGWFNSNIRKEFLQLLQSKCGVPIEECQGSNRNSLPAQGLSNPPPVFINLETVLEMEEGSKNFVQPLSSRGVPLRVETAV